MNTVLKIEFLSNILSQIKGCFLTGSHNTRKARRNDGTRRLQAENAVLKNERTPIEGRKRAKRKTEIVRGLVTEFTLEIF